MTQEEKRRIKQAALTFLALFVVFNVLVSGRILSHRLPQNQWQQNIIRAETYVFKKNAWKYVVLGSSLAYRLAPGVDREDAYVMAFAGDSASTGVEIIRRSGKYPQCLFIETNTLGQKPDEGKIEPLFSWRGKIRKTVITLREENAPLNFILYPVARAAFAAGEWFSSLSGQWSPSNKGEEKESNQDASRVKAGNKTAVQSTKQKTELRAGVIPENLRNNPETKKMEEQLILFQAAVKDLEAHGVKVFFFEMPMDDSHKTDSFKILKMELGELFPEDRYPRVPETDDRSLGYSDGLHLDMPSSLSYARFLMKFFPEDKPGSR